MFSVDRSSATVMEASAGKRTFISSSRPVHTLSLAETMRSKNSDAAAASRTGTTCLPLPGSARIIVKPRAFFCAATNRR